MKIQFNKEALIYFVVSWVASLLLIPVYCFDNSDMLLLFLAINFLNVPINITSILIMIFYAYIFKEKRNDFTRSAIFLLFNLPILSTAFFVFKIFIL